MAVYKCLECGHLFEDGEQATWIEPHGEEWSGCPLCKGDYEETKRCRACGNESFLEEELIGGICEECMHEYSEDFDFCIEVGRDCPTEVKINGAIAEIWSSDEINDYLIQAASQIKNLSFEKFVERDRSFFAQMIEDEVNKNEKK